MSTQTKQKIEVTHRDGGEVEAIGYVSAFELDTEINGTTESYIRLVAFFSKIMPITFMGVSRSEIWRLVLVLLIGQLLSLFLAVVSFTSSYIADLGVKTPLTQSLITYLLLAVVYGGIFQYRRQKLLVAWYWYVILAIADVHGNYLYVKAYQYSSITSVTLLDCFTIAWAMMLTYFILRTHYTIWQFLGAAICVVGLALVLLSDSGVSGGGGSNPLLGDALVIAATLCYAISNVGEEFCVKKKDGVEFLAMLGCIGGLISLWEIYMFERKELVSVQWSARIIALFAGYATASFLFYTAAIFLLKMSGATLLNLSLLTSDMWAVLIRIFFYKQQVDWLYYFAFAIVAVGLIIYSLSDRDKMSSTDGMENEEEINPLIEEC